MDAAQTIPFGKPMIGDDERHAVGEVLAGTTLTHGPRVQEFEQAFAEYTGAPWAIATATCWAALHLAYLAIDLKPGDEVIVPAQTHVATAHAVEICGAKPVFCDAGPRTGNMDLDQLESLITDRTRALSLVHFLGRPVDMGRFMAIARRHDLYVVEDCAVALGGRYDDVHVGLHGDIGCFSFYPVKHITTGEGGMIVTRNAELADRVSKQRAFGIDRSILADRRHTGEYDVVELGLNYRMGEIGAAMGRVQIARLPEFLERRERNYDQLHAGLEPVDALRVLESGHDGPIQASFYCLTAVLEPQLAPRRDQVIDALRARGVGTSVYYPKAIPDTSYYRDRYGYPAGSCPEATKISTSSIAFTVGPHVSEPAVERMIAATREALDEVGRG